MSASNPLRTLHLACHLRVGAAEIDGKIGVEALNEGQATDGFRDGRWRYVRLNGHCQRPLRKVIWIIAPHEVLLDYGGREIR
jgi:hypothetical protein